MLQLSRWKVTLVILSLIFGVLFALPNVLPASVRASWPGFLPSQTVNLGLDLQGGSYLLMEVDIPAMRREQLSNTVEDIRTSFRTEQIAGQPALRNGVIYVRVTDPARIPAAQRVISRLADTTTGTPDFTVAREAVERLRLD
jgi:preprotein translocase subunit SecD